MSGHLWHFYDETERRTWQNPEEILTAAGLQAGQSLVDIGCGQGFFSLPAARLVGPTGQIYAFDSSSEAIDQLRQKAAREGLSNLTLNVREGEAEPLNEGYADFVFMGIVLHDFQDPLKVLQNARRMLKPQGRLLNLDWKKENMKLGPPIYKRFDIAAASALIQQAGFTLRDTRDAGPYCYLIIADN